VLAGWSSIDRLANIKVPALLLWGRHDTVCSVPQSRRIAAHLPTAEVAIFENSGHFPWVEEAQAFFAVLNAWLTRKALA
jgi:pimeloyl-ACP methyl ester carboxylesterase